MECINLEASEHTQKKWRNHQMCTESGVHSYFVAISYVLCALYKKISRKKCLMSPVFFCITFTVIW